MKARRAPVQVRLRPNWGLPPRLARQRNLPINCCSAYFRPSDQERRAFLSCAVYGRADRERVERLIHGGDVAGEATRKAPAQAELRPPTCAGASREVPELNSTLKMSAPRRPA